MTRDRIIALATTALLGTVAWVAYAPTTGFPFVAYDDNARLLSNAAVRGGVSWPGIYWAFTSTWDAGWSPITWISHMLDFSLYSGDAGGHHAVNVGLHATNVVLLFLALRTATGDVLRPACVALLLAIHPIHVESVAWISEREGLLSSTFAFAALWCHVADLRRGEPRWRTQSLLLFALGLMTSPLLVSLPFALLLIARLVPGATREGAVSLRSQVLAIWPWFALAAASAAITLWSLQQGGAVREIGAVPLLPRISNALVTSVLYLGKLVWPTNLAPYYPHPNLPGGTPWSLLQVAGAAAFWAVAGSLTWWSRIPALRIGLAWYAITLLPAIGLVQLGSEAMADRYAYLPAIGIYLALVWTVVDTLRGAGRILLGTTGAAALVGLGSLAWAGQQQISIWRSTEALFRYTVSVTDANFPMHFNLANTLKGRGRIEEAIEHYRAAIAIHPGMGVAHFNLANTLVSEGRPGEAVGHYRAAIAALPEFQPAREALGRILIQLGDLPASLAHYREEVARRPRSLRARVDLAHLLRMAGDLPAAAEAYEAAADLPEGDERWRQEARAIRAQIAESDAGG